MTSKEKFTFHQDGTVQSVNDTEMKKVIQSGGAGKYAQSKGKEARKKAKEKLEMDYLGSSSSSQGTSSSRRMKNRMYKTTSTAAKRSEVEALQQVDVAGTVQEYSLQVFSDRLDAQCTNADRTLSEIRNHKERKK